MTTTKIFVAALVCCLGLGFSSKVSANSWRVNSDKRANANFQDLNAAMADERVTDGDTLYMDKRCTIATEQTISKKVTIIGPGYFIGENDADEAYFSNAINLEADGIKLTGLHISNVNIRENNAIIERCRVTGNIIATEKYENDEADIHSCFIEGHIVGNSDNGSSEDWKITNNIFYDTQYNGMCIEHFRNVVIDHNSFYKTGWQELLYNVKNSSFTNNIVMKTNTGYFFKNTAPEDNNIFSHNVLTTSLGNNYPNNQQIAINPSIVFNSPDSLNLDMSYSLPDDSPAKDYAEDGSDCGPFTGAHPYVMSGYPLYVPRFESITIPSQPDQSGNLTIQMIIKNQNK